MRRREVGLSVAFGLALLLLAFVNPGGIGSIIGQWLLGPAATFWYVGVGLVALAFTLQSQRVRPGLVQIVGLIGIAWTTLVAGAVAWLVVILATSGPFGP